MPIFAPELSPTLEAPSPTSARLVELTLLREPGELAEVLPTEFPSVVVPFVCVVEAPGAPGHVGSSPDLLMMIPWAQAGQPLPSLKVVEPTSTVSCSGMVDHMANDR